MQTDQQRLALRWNEPIDKPDGLCSDRSEVQVNRCRLGSILREFRRSFRLCVGIALSAVILAASMDTALAGTATSSLGYYSNNGVSYKNSSSISTNHANSHQAYASTYVGVTAGTAEIGWIGVLPRRYSDTGVLQCTGSWNYSSSAIGVGGSISAPGCFNNTHASYTSDGQTKAFNGSTYSTYGAFTSPAQTS